MPHHGHSHCCSQRRSRCSSSYSLLSSPYSSCSSSNSSSKSSNSSSSSSHVLHVQHNTCPHLRSKFLLHLVGLMCCHSR